MAEQQIDGRLLLAQHPEKINLLIEIEQFFHRHRPGWYAGAHCKRVGWPQTTTGLGRRHRRHPAGCGRWQRRLGRAQRLRQRAARQQMLVWRHQRGCRQRAARRGARRVRVGVGRRPPGVCLITLQTPHPQAQPHSARSGRHQAQHQPGQPVVDGFGSRQPVAQLGQLGLLAFGVGQQLQQLALQLHDLLGGAVGHRRCGRCAAGRVGQRSHGRRTGQPQHLALLRAGPAQAGRVCCGHRQQQAGSGQQRQQQSLGGHGWHGALTGFSHRCKRRDTEEHRHDSSMLPAAP